MSRRWADGNGVSESGCFSADAYNERLEWAKPIGGICAGDEFFVLLQMRVEALFHGGTT